MLPPMPVFTCSLCFMTEEFNIYEKQIIFANEKYISRTDMKFRTEYKAIQSSVSFTPAEPVVLLGSCFAENIASKMRESLWWADNPLGTLYNPLSIAKALRLSLLSMFPEKEFEKSLFLSEQKYHSWYFDSSFSAYSAVDAIASFNSRRLMLSDMLSKGNKLIVTFGTAWIYLLQSKNLEPVGNCHKQPSSLFLRKRLSILEIVDEWTSLLELLRKFLPSLEVVFTVSPVRHLKDGFEGNSQSKAILLLAVEELCKKFDFCSYFPAFEIVNDDLGDYRFYASDLVHPSDEAIEYVWEIFKDTFINKEAREILSKGEKIYKAINHRPLPDASVLIPGPVNLKVEKYRNEIIEDYIDFKKLYPDILTLKLP